MSKKLLFSILIALCAALTVGSLALAASGKAAAEKGEGVIQSPLAQATVRPRASTRLVGAWEVGQVTSLGTDHFGLNNLRGDAHTVLVDARTRYLTVDGDLRGIENLKESSWVIVTRGRDAQADTPARAVILLPEGFNPQDWRNQRGRGTVATVDTASGTFTLKNLKGSEKTYIVSRDTHFLGAVQNLGEVKDGMVAAVAFKDENGKLAVSAMFAHYPLGRSAGIIKSLDRTTGMFSLATRKGEMVDIMVDSSTRFISRGNTVASLGDLSEGTVVVVFSKDLPDGKHLANIILAGKPKSKK